MIANLIPIWETLKPLIVPDCIVIISIILFSLITNKIINILLIKLKHNRSQGTLKAINEHNIKRYLFHSVFVLYIAFCMRFLNLNQFLSPNIINAIDICLFLYGTLAFTTLLSKSIDIFTDVYKNYFLNIHFPIHLPVQVFKTLILILAIIITISRILNLSPISIITSLGAATALLTFVFKDAISSLIASLQIILQNKVQIGDWINIPQYNIKGHVKVITVTQIMIRANNGSVITILPSLLLTANVINWREIKQLKSRTIDRVIYMDINSIAFCSDSLIEHLKQSKELMNIFDKTDYITNSRSKKTNLELFKYYIDEYLKDFLNDNEQENNYLVYESETPIQGVVTVEISIFLNKIEWETYEKMNSEIFLHLIAILPEFQLKLAPK